MSRQDPYMARARELAAAAGVDPDERVFKLGSDRGQPAWCLYRTAARDEHLAAEAAETAQEALSVVGQEARYHNAPLVVFGQHEQSTLDQMRNCMSVGNVVGGVLCADGHLGYAQPVGGVIAYKDQISVSGVGYDIGCGNMAVQTDLFVEDLDDHLLLATEIRDRISFGVGRRNDKRVEHELFDDKEAWKAADREDYLPRAREQLGTVGSGNHYVDLMHDRNGIVWVGVHFGSRGLGHSSAAKYLKAAGGKDGMNVLPTVLDVSSELGTRYLAAMELAGRYAYAGREWVVQEVRSILGAQVRRTVHNHHNYAWKEGGNWVVRKGATPAFPGQQGFVGGSMGDDAVIVEGLATNRAAFALNSTIHGAGRLFGRKEAKRRFTQAEMDTWLQQRDVTVLGGDLDESPMAYRRLPDVLRAHEGTVKVRETLRPFVVVMAGDAEFDPWKD